MSTGSAAGTSSASSPLPDPPHAQAAAHSLPSAGTWRRLMGIAYECVILFAVLFFFGYAYSALGQFKGQSDLGRLGLQAWIFLVLAIYFGYFWSRGRRSLPMKTLSLALVDRHGAALGVPRALARYCAVWLCLAVPLALAKFAHPAAALLLLVPLATTLLDRQRRALYDMLAGSRLVYSAETDGARRSPKKD